MDSVRYYLALVLVVILPPALLFWLIVHPFIGFWRRLGPAWTYTIVGSVVVIAMVGIFLIRGPLLAIEFGTRYPLLVLGLLCLGVAVRLRVLLGRQLNKKMLIGLPELAPDRHRVQLMTEGLYSRVRHPRYVQFQIALLGYALIANTLALYLTFMLWMAGIAVIVVLEERELRARFGEEYEDYCGKAPRFVPRFRP